MTMAKWRHPLDPKCPAVRYFTRDLLSDPLTQMGAPIDDIMEDFERRHRSVCERCRLYGLENIEISD